MITDLVVELLNWLLTWFRVTYVNLHNHVWTSESSTRVKVQTVAI